MTGEWVRLLGAVLGRRYDEGELLDQLEELVHIDEEIRGRGGIVLPRQRGR